MSGFSLLACAGSSGVIIWKCFNVAGHLSKQQYKRELARAVRASTLFTIGSRLPSDCTLAFEAVFTDKLWSVRGFIRSCMASLAVVTALFIVWYSSIPDEWHLRISNLEAANDPGFSSWWLISMRGYAIDIGLHGDLHTIQGGGEPMTLTRLDVLVFYPFLYNIVADFLALLFTERILVTLSMRHTTIIGLILTLLASACLLLVLAFYALQAAGTTIGYIIHAILRPRGHVTAPPFLTYVSTFTNAVWFPFYKNRPDQWNVGTIYGVFVWSTLMGVLWLGIFSTSVIIANVSTNLQGLGPWLDQRFRVGTEPFKILAALAIIFLTAVCIIGHIFLWIVAAVA